MEDYPPGAWELDRPEIAHWLRNFVDMSPSTLLQRVRLTIQALSARIAELDIVDEEEDEDGIEVDSPSIALHPPPTVAQGALSENIPKVRRVSFEFVHYLTDRQCTTCIDNGHYCLRKANQKYGARCTVCAKLRKKCSIVEEVKISSPHSRKASRSKKVPSMEEVAIAVDIPDPNPQSFIGALKQGIKRKLTDRSPEAASSSMRPPATQAQLGARSSASLPLPFAFEEIAPPPSSSPSIRSFASSQSANFETERLRMLLNESQEDLRFQQHQHEQQVAEMARRFDEQQRRWQNKLATQQAFYESMYGGDGDDGKGGSVASGSKTRRK